jgi:hypothetical protein
VIGVVVGAAHVLMNMLIDMSTMPPIMHVANAGSVQTSSWPRQCVRGLPKRTPRFQYQIPWYLEMRQ